MFSSPSPTTVRAEVSKPHAAYRIRHARGQAVAIRRIDRHAGFAGLREFTRPTGGTALLMIRPA